MLIAFCLVQWLGLTENSLAPPLFLPITYTYKWEKNQHLSILFSWLNNAVSFILSSYVRCSKPLVIFMALCWACLSSIFYQGAQHLTQYCRYVSSALGREKGSLLLTFWLRSASVQVRMLLSFFATYCITASLFFSDKLFSSMDWRLKLFLCWSRSSYFLLLNFMRLLPSHFPILLGSLWTAVQPSDVIKHFSQFCISGTLTEGTAFPIIQVDDEDVKQFCLQWQSFVVHLQWLTSNRTLGCRSQPSEPSSSVLSP